MDFVLKLDARKDLSFGDKVKKCKEWLEEHDETSAGFSVVQFATGQYENQAKQEEEYKKQQKTIQVLKQNKDEKSLKKLKRTFPYLQDATFSLPHDPQCHAEAKIRKATHDPIHDASFSGLWDSDFIRESGTCDSESETLHASVDLLRAVLKGMKVDSLVDMALDRTLAGKECDILLVYKPNRLPFAAIEVKKPGNSKEGRSIVWGNRVAGEMYDELKAIQLFGFSSVTGMITTFNQWRLVGLIDDDDDDETRMKQQSGEYCIQSTSVLTTVKSFFESQSWTSAMTSEKHKTDSPNEKAVVSDEKRGNGNETRLLWACDAVPAVGEEANSEEIRKKVEASGESIVQEVVLFVAQAWSYLQKLLQKEPNAQAGPHNIPLERSIPCRILVNEKMQDGKSKDKVFAFGTVKLDKLNLNVFCKTEELHVIHHLGMGEFGNVCLAVSRGGSSACAVKFYHKRLRREEYAADEKKNWDLLYGDDKGIPDPYIVNSAGGDCLVMPYLHPIPPHAREESLNKGGPIENLLKRIAGRGRVYMDIKWQHFRLKKPAKPCMDEQVPVEARNIYLVDLGKNSLTKLEDPGLAGKWVAETIERMRLLSAHEAKGNPVESPESILRSEM